MNWVLILGLLIHAIALPIVLRRVWFLYRLARNGQPAPDRIASVRQRFGRAAKTEAVEVFGQRRLLQWTIPGLAHFFTFWAFVILGTVYLEAYGVLLGPDNFSIPVIGDWWILGFAQDTIALLVLVSIATFLVIRLKNSPAKLGRKSRFKGSHEFGAYLVLFFIFLVVATMFVFRGAAEALGNFHNPGAYASNFIGNHVFNGLGHQALEVVEGIGLLAHLAVMLVFLIEVVHSKHLHVLVAPLNVIFKRHPIALGAAKPMMSDGKPITLDDVDDLDEDAKLGVGSIEDFSWKGILDMQSCTECGRCQSQCPAWNTEKPLSPKLLIMALRDHAYDAGPYLLADEGRRDTLTAAKAEAERPLVGETEGEPWAPTGGGIIDPDVLWSCVTCGACVQQCPVDIEHVDHILDMRRYQVLVESNFPAELNQLFKGMENKGNPWNMSPTARMDWAKGLEFDVPVVGEDLESLESVDWLFWVGCAGAYEDRAKKTTRAVAELLNIAGISFGVLGNGETCTGDSARRAGNEFVFQGLAQQNIETFKEYQVKQVVTTCPHCLNTLKNEYKDLGIELEVVHHTQLLNRLVRDGKLTPVTDGAGAAKRSITYHDPCYLGRHNQVYNPPRELLQIMPGAEFVEMERSRERSFCCGAGGARMWMEETIGTRINDTRTLEAVGTGADQIAVGCPFCRVMLSDGLLNAQADGKAAEAVEVLDVAQMLLASVKGVQATRLAPGESTGEVQAKAKAEKSEAASQEAATPADTEAATTEPSAKSAGGSLFDDAAVEESPAQSGGSLFDHEPAVSETASGKAAEPAPDVTTESKPTTGSEDLGGGSLFDLGGDTPASPESTGTESTGTGPAGTESAGDEQPGADAEEPTPTAAAQDVQTESKPAAPAEDLGAGGSLFDIPAETPAPAAKETATETAPETATGTDSDAGEPEPADAELEAEPQPDAQAETKAQAQPEAAGGSATDEQRAEPATEAAPVDFSGSLFDIPAQETSPTEVATTGGSPARGEAPTLAPESTSESPAEPESGEDRVSGADLSASATFAASEDHEGTIFEADDQAPPSSDAVSEAPAAEPEVAPEAPPAEEADEAAKEPAQPSEPAEAAEPAGQQADGAGHSPRTDADIHNANSLFDL